MNGRFKNSRVMLISIQVVVEVDVVLGNRCSLVAWFTTFLVCPVVVGGWCRAGNSGGTREPSSQKEFGFAESFFDFEVFTELNSKNVSEITAKIICFA